MKHQNQSRGFTLFELLIVMAIILALIGLIVPVMGVMRSISLSQEVDLVIGELKKARQTAIAENRMIEVRLYSYSGQFGDPDDKVIRSLQVWKREESGLFTAETGIRHLAEPVIISEDPAITQIGPSVTPASADEANLPSGYTYRVFQFRPDGSTNLDLSVQWYFTMHLENDEGAPPTNFATFQIEPLTGSVNVHRP